MFRRTRPMRISSHFGFFLSGAATIALLAGCSGGGSQLPTTIAPISPLSQSARTARSLGVSVWPSKVSQTSQTDFVDVAGVNSIHGNQTIVSDASNNTVSVYGADGHRHAVLTAGLSQPEGIATDATETLY